MLSAPLTALSPAPSDGHTHEGRSALGAHARQPHPYRLKLTRHGWFVFLERSAAWQLLESFSDQLLKLLRLRGVSLHLVLSKLRLKHQNVLEGLCVADLAG